MCLKVSITLNKQPAKRIVRAAELATRAQKYRNAVGVDRITKEEALLEVAKALGITHVLEETKNG